MKIEELTCINNNINIDEYIEFMNIVKESMDYPDWLGDFTKDTLIELLNTNSKIWIYYMALEPVCSMMLIPSDKDSINKFNLDLDYKSVADYGPMFVNPKYIGNKLQYQMLKELDKYCIKAKYKYAVATVHPNNTYSINNLLKDGFKQVGQREFKRGIRNIYLKKLI